MVDPITKDTNIEDLIDSFPQAVGLLIEYGLPCVICGEPFWGTVQELAANKGWDSARIDQLINDLNSHRSRLH